jgi:hypothetical protein
MTISLMCLTLAFIYLIQFFAGNVTVQRLFLFLGALTKLRKATVNFDMSARQSVRMEQFSSQ